MLRKNIMMTQKHAELLKKEAEEQQVSMSEILRRAIDAYLKGGKQ